MYSYWQNTQQVAENAESEPTRIYPTERGSSSGITSAAKEDRLYQSRGYPTDAPQTQATSDSNINLGYQKKSYQNTAQEQYYQGYPSQIQNVSSQQNQVYYDQNMQSQEPQQFLNNNNQNYDYRYR